MGVLMIPNVGATVDVNWKTVAAVGGVVLLVYYLARKTVTDVAGAVGEGAAAVGRAVNPVSDQNLIYRGIGAVGGAVSGDSSWSLGGAIYDLLHPQDANVAAKTNNLTAASDADGRPTILR